MDGSTIGAILCPACAMGQGEAGSGGVLLIAALLLVPLVAAAVAGFVIVRLLARPPAPVAGSDRRASPGTPVALDSPDPGG